MMTARYKKKLIEVAIPLEAVNAASAREKPVRATAPVTRGFVHEPRYADRALVEREPSLLETAIQFDLRRLMERAQASR